MEELAVFLKREQGRISEKIEQATQKNADEMADFMSQFLQSAPESGQDLNQISINTEARIKTALDKIAQTERSNSQSLLQQPQRNHFIENQSQPALTLQQ